jgi:glycyl-tRNA synthetase (class II)
MPRKATTALKELAGLFRTEEFAIELLEEFVKDELKSYLREKLNKNPKLKAELKSAITEYVEAKFKEMYALLKIAKCTAKIGLELTPPKLRAELTKELMAIFEKELFTMFEKT